MCVGGGFPVQLLDGGERGLSSNYYTCAEDEDV